MTTALQAGTLYRFFEPATHGAARLEHFDVDAQAARMSAYRALAQPFEDAVQEGRYTRLRVRGRTVMSDTFMEVRTNAHVVHMARGRVFIAGLGLGLIVVPIAEKLEVSEVVIVEQEADVIALVEPALRARLGTLSSKVTIVEGDARTWAPPQGEQFDTIYFDIWSEYSLDTLDEMYDLHEQAAPWAARDAFVSSWRFPDLRHMAGHDRDDPDEGHYDEGYD